MRERQDFAGLPVWRSKGLAKPMQRPGQGDPMASPGEIQRLGQGDPKVYSGAIQWLGPGDPKVCLGSDLTILDGPGCHLVPVWEAWDVLLAVRRAFLDSPGCNFSLKVFVSKKVNYFV